ARSGLTFSDIHSGRIVFGRLAGYISGRVRRRSAWPDSGRKWETCWSRGTWHPAGSAGSPHCNFARMVHLLPPRGLSTSPDRTQGSHSSNQTFDAVVAKDHPAWAIRPCVWPTPILNEGYDLAFDIKAVASPNPGADLTVVIQT